MDRSKLYARRPRRGFSLVLSLVVMAMLLLLCIGAASILSIQLRVAQASVSHAKARMNAMVAARIALGQLQALAGNDRRITASASIQDGDPKTWATADGGKQPRVGGGW